MFRSFITVLLPNSFITNLGFQEVTVLRSSLVSCLKASLHVTLVSVLLAFPGEPEQRLRLPVRE